MTHMERLINAISHEQPDRVQLDLGGTRDTSIVIEGYEKLKKYFGVKDNNDLSDRMMRVVKVDEDILNKLDIDTCGVFMRTPIKNYQEIHEDRYLDVWGIERVKLENNYYFEQIKYPLSGSITTSDIVNYKWPDPNDLGFTEGLRQRIAWIKDNTNCAIILSLLSPFIHISQYLRGFEDWFCDLLSSTKVIEAIFDAVLEITLEIAKNEMSEVGKDVDVVICTDNLGTQKGLQVSKELYLKYLKPRHKKYFKQIHDLSTAKFLFHTCGSVKPIIEDLIDIGVDILNPVQTTAAGMNPKILKKEYKGKLAFWGAMDTKKVLPFGKVEDVKKIAEKRIEDLGDGGGYVLAPCHNIQPDVPAENILAMFKHARNYIP